MRKRYIAAGVAGAVGATVAGYYFKNREESKKKNSPFEDAGIPDQTNKMDLAQFENAKMVSEGSQFGVNYYNEMREVFAEEEVRE